jgi:hypothetical protein
MPTQNIDAELTMLTLIKNLPATPIFPLGSAFFYHWYAPEIHHTCLLLSLINNYAAACCSPLPLPSPLTLEIQEPNLTTCFPFSPAVSYHLPVAHLAHAGNSSCVGSIFHIQYALRNHEPSASIVHFSAQNEA